MNSSKSLINSIILAVLVLVAISAAIWKFDSYLRIKAIDDCFRISQFSQNLPNGAHVSYPMSDIYQKCLKEKGYTGSYQ